MSAHSLSVIEQLDPHSLDDHYDLDFEFADQRITVDLNFDHKTIDPKRLEMVKNFMTQIEAFDKINKDRIKQDYADDTCDTVDIYIQYFIEDNDKGDIGKYVNLESKELNIKQQLVDKFRLVRVGFYPNNITHFATFDYTISIELSDDIVVIFTNQIGDMDYMTLES